MKPLFIAALVASALLPWVWNTEVLYGKEEPTIKGVVIDPMNALIPSVTIIFTKLDQQPIAMTSVTTGDDGSYSTSLGPGTYEVTASHTGFCPGHRANLLLHENDEIQIDFQLLVCAFMDPVELPPLAESLPTIIPPGERGNGYGEEQLSPIASTGLHPFILFGRRDKQAGAIVYHGLLNNRTELPPTFSYNLTTLKARTLIYVAKDSSIEAIDNVTWQDGRQTRRRSRVKVSIVGEYPKLLFEE